MLVNDINNLKQKIINVADSILKYLATKNLATIKSKKNFLSGEHKVTWTDKWPDQGKKIICRLAKVTLDSLLLSHFGSSHNVVVGEEQCVEPRNSSCIGDYTLDSVNVCVNVNSTAG